MIKREWGLFRIFHTFSYLLLCFLCLQSWQSVRCLRLCDSAVSYTISVLLQHSVISYSLCYATPLTYISLELVGKRRSRTFQLLPRLEMEHWDVSEINRENTFCYCIFWHSSMVFNYLSLKLQLLNADFKGKVKKLNALSNLRDLK